MRFQESNTTTGSRANFAQKSQTLIKEAVRKDAANVVWKFDPYFMTFFVSQTQTPNQDKSMGKDKLIAKDLESQPGDVFNKEKRGNLLTTAWKLLFSNASASSCWEVLKALWCSFFVSVFLLSDPPKITSSPSLFDNPAWDSCRIIINIPFPRLGATPSLS